MCKWSDLDAPVPLGLRLLLSKSLEDGHCHPQNSNPTEWNRECIDDVLNVELVGVSFQDVNCNLQRCVHERIDDHTEDTQDDQ